MPAKSSASAASPKPAAKVTPAAKAKPAKAAAPAPAVEAPKTVKMSKAPGSHVAQVTRRTAIDSRPVVSSAERDRLIAEAAYYRAESRGFAPGDEQADWFASVQEVDAKYRCDG